MNYLIKSAKIVDSNSSFNNQTKDILIENGVITKIEDSISCDTTKEILEFENLHVSIGWFDTQSLIPTPGFEWKEDFQSGTNAANYGGYSEIAILPNTLPSISNASIVEMIRNKSRLFGTIIHPIGSISQNINGEELSEMYDMKQSGAIAFSDGKKYVSTGLMSRALLYTKNFNSLIISFPNDYSLSKGGQVHEGISQTKTGLKGIPSISEIINIERDLKLAEYHDCKIHFSCISTKEGVELIKKAKNEGLKVSCSVAAHQLYYNDSSIESFDSNYKVIPPYRGEEDRIALFKGVIEGTIDTVCSDHTPCDIESKNLEFDLAEFGIIGLETSYACINSILKDEISIQQIIDLLTINSRKLFNLSIPKIEINNKANLTLFNPYLKWTYNLANIQSKSKNTPFIGTNFTGKAYKVII